MKVLFILSFIIIFGTGCASVKLSPEGKTVKLSKNEPTGCKELGDVMGVGSSTSKNPIEARHDMRNKSARMGANYVTFDTYYIPPVGGAEVTGRAYRCPASHRAIQPYRKKVSSRKVSK